MGAMIGAMALKGRKSTNTLDPFLTKEQMDVQDMLSKLATTGQYGDLRLGEAYTGSLGDFDMTDAERSSYGGLMRLINSASPEGFGTARRTLTGLADNKFNPDDPSSGYAAFSRQVARATGEANDVLNREAAITGDRYSSSIGGQKRDLALRQSDALSSKLADLYNTAQDRSLSASQALGNLETMAQDADINKLQAGFQMGSLPRLLNTARAGAAYDEFNRQRQEKLSRVGIGQNLFGRNVQFGTMSNTIESPHILSQMIGSINPIVGEYNRAKYGAANAPGQMTMADMIKLIMSTGKMAGGGM